MSTSPLEPWPGFKKLSVEDRRTVFEQKVIDARLRGDLLYAVALSVAVAATEQLARGGDDPTELEQTARKAAKAIDENGPALVKEAGGWTPK
jgi:hypothetical protein